MPKPVVAVRNVRPEDQACWRQMWAGYLTFYNQSLRRPLPTQRGSDFLIRKARFMP